MQFYFSKNRPPHNFKQDLYKGERKLSCVFIERETTNNNSNETTANFTASVAVSRYFYAKLVDHKMFVFEAILVMIEIICLCVC